MTVSSAYLGELFTPAFPTIVYIYVKPKIFVDSTFKVKTVIGPTERLVQLGTRLLDIVVRLP